MVLEKNMSNDMFDFSVLKFFDINTTLGIHIIYKQIFCIFLLDGLRWTLMVWLVVFQSYCYMCWFV